LVDFKSEKAGNAEIILNCIIGFGTKIHIFCGSSPPKVLELQDAEEVTSVAFNTNSSRIAFTTTNKTLGTVEALECKLICSRTLSKKASCLKIANWKGQEVLVVADTTGDVLVFPFPGLNDHCQPHHAIGHTGSIVTDMALSSCGHFIVTCDRDEKVRVSQWPNTWTVQTYCLGHRDFISCCATAPEGCLSGKELLLSGGGDGRVILWNLTNGAQLGIHQLSCSENPEECSPGANPELVQDRKQRNGFASGVALFPEANLAAVILNQSTDILLFRIGGADQGLTPYGKLACQHQPLAIMFSSDGTLVALVCAPIFLQTWEVSSILQAADGLDGSNGATFPLLQAEKAFEQTLESWRRFIEETGYMAPSFSSECSSPALNLDGKLRKNKCYSIADWNLKKHKRK